MPDFVIKLKPIVHKIPALAVGAGDKTPLGQTGALLEEALSLAENANHNVAFLFRELVNLCDSLIIDDFHDQELGETFLAEATEKLKKLVDGPATEFNEITNAMLHDAGKLSEGATDSSADAKAEVSLEPDIVNISSPEDEAIYQEFLIESHEHLEKIESGALELENTGMDVDLINDMFRCFHSMKGAAGFLGLTRVNQLCHETEAMLDRARKFTLQITPEVAEVILAAIDTAKHLLAVVDIQIQRAQSGTSSDEPLPVVDISGVLKSIEIILEAPQAKANTVLDDQATPNKLGGALVAEGEITQQQLSQALKDQQRPVGQILVDMGATTDSKVQEALGAAGGKRLPSMIKVDTSRLDSLLEMVGELVISQSLVSQDEMMAGSTNHEFTKKVGRLSKITLNLQELVMSLRLVALRQAFNKMQRLVRDTARKTNKEVKLVLSGEDTEIDKTVIDELADPLVHLMRNAVDHGCETPDVREAAGKPREATVQLKAYHQGGNVVIDIVDDGKGLDRDKLLAKALEKGMAKDGVTYTDAEIFKFIFQPGFSTVEKASDISGRGVGMDVVRRNIENLGGRVDITSELGKGSVFTVRLPLTMAIVDGMLVKVGEERYVMPTIGIEESIRPEPDQITSVAGKGEMMMVRGDLVPLVRISNLFNVEGAIHNPCEALVIVISSGTKRCGVVVDELLGQHQVVVKNLGSSLQDISGISGGSILGDGQVGLILDVPGLIDLSQNGQGASKAMQEVG